MRNFLGVKDLRVVNVVNVVNVVKVVLQRLFCTDFSSNDKMRGFLLVSCLDSRE
jgi:hypothetical protein